MFLKLWPLKGTELWGSCATVTMLQTIYLYTSNEGTVQTPCELPLNTAATAENVNEMWKRLKKIIGTR